MNKQHLIAFSALTPFVGCQEEHPACKTTEWWGAGVVICVERGANDLHMIQLMPLPICHLLPYGNPDWFNLSGASFPRLSWKRGHEMGACLISSIWSTIYWL